MSGGGAREVRAACWGNGNGMPASREEEGVCFCNRDVVGDWFRDGSLECEGLTKLSSPPSRENEVKREESRLAIVGLLDSFTPGKRRWSALRGWHNCEQTTRWKCAKLCLYYHEVFLEKHTDMGRDMI